MGNNSKASKIFQGLLFAVSVGMLVYFCITGNNLVILLQTLPTLNLFWLLGAVACIGVVWLLDSLVLYNMVSLSYGGDYSRKNAFKVTMVGQYFNSITPFAVAGQPMQIVALTRQGVGSGVALSALVRKFLVYQTTLTCFSFLVIMAKYNYFRSKIPGFMALAFIGFLCQAAVVIVLFFFSHNRRLTVKIINGVMWLLTKLHVVKKPEESSKKVLGQFDFYVESNKAMQGNRKMTLKVYGLTLLQLVTLFSIPFFIYKAFHNTGFPVVDMVAAQSFVTMITSYTPLPGAAGAAEGGFLMLFQLFFQKEVISQAMLLWRLITYYSCILVGAFFAGIGDKKEKLKVSLKREQRPKDA